MAGKFDVCKIDFRKHRTKIIIISLVFFAMLLYAYVIHFSTVVPASETFNANIDTVFADNQQIVEIMPSTTVTQSFTAEENIAGFSLYFGDIASDIQGTLHVALVDAGSGAVVYQKDLDLRELVKEEDQDPNYPFVLDTPLKHVKENRYNIVVSTSGQNSDMDTVSIISSEGNRYFGGKCAVDGEPTGGDLSFRIFESTNTFMIPVYWTFVAFIALGFVASTYLLLLNRFKIERLFVISVICIGTIYIFLMTPLSIPDEPAHFDTAYRYSNLMMFKGDAPEEDHIYMRADDIDYLEHFSICPHIEEYNYITNTVMKTAENKTLVSVKAQVIETTPYVYIPAAIGITLGRILGLGSAMVFYLGRFANLIAFACAGFLAIRKIPFGKMIFFVVGMLPMTLQQVSSYSYDAVVFGLAFLFISYCLHAAYDEVPLRRRDITILCVLGVFLAPAKAVYVFVCLLVFLIPKERYSPLKMHGNKKAKCLAAMLGSSIISFSVYNLLSIIMTYVNAQTNVLSYGTVSGYTASFLLANPGKLFMIIRLTLLNESSYFFESMLGKYLGWLNMEVSSILMYVFFALLILAAIKEDREKVHLKKRSKILLAFIVGSVFALVCAAMLLSFTPMTENSIVGVQGRYFLPVLPLALLFFRNDRIVVKRDMTQLIVFAEGTLQILTIAYVFQWVLLQSLVK